MGSLAGAQGSVAGEEAESGCESREEVADCGGESDGEVVRWIKVKK